MDAIVMQLRFFFIQSCNCFMEPGQAFSQGRSRLLSNTHTHTSPGRLNRRLIQMPPFLSPSIYSSLPSTCFCSNAVLLLCCGDNLRRDRVRWWMGGGWGCRRTPSTSPPSRPSAATPSSAPCPSPPGSFATPPTPRGRGKPPKESH